MGFSTTAYCFWCSPLHLQDSAQTDKERERCPCGRKVSLTWQNSGAEGQKYDTVSIKQEGTTTITGS